MSLEQALAENTAALNRVAALLEVSNAARADLLAKNGVATPTATPAASSDDGMSVAEVKEAVKTADLATLKTMLAEEQNGKNRTTAISAIEAAIEAATPKAEPAPNAPAGGVAAPDTSTEAPKTSESAPAGETKATVLSGEAAAQAFGDWFASTNDEAERNARRAFVGEIVKKFGKRVGELDEDGRTKAIFWLRRKQAGLEVDFDAAYDFSGDPQQSVGGAADDDLL